MPLTVGHGPKYLDSDPMEWMLQVADELDDAMSVLRLYTLGWGQEIGPVLASGAAACAVCAALLRGAA